MQQAKACKPSYLNGLASFFLLLSVKDGIIQQNVMCFQWDFCGIMKIMKKHVEVRKMTKVDIFSGFLGAGKTTLIKKLIEEAYKDEQIVLIENEFGDGCLTLQN